MSKWKISCFLLFSFLFSCTPQKENHEEKTTENLKEENVQNFPEYWFFGLHYQSKKDTINTLLNEKGFQFLSKENSFVKQKENYEIKLYPFFENQVLNEMIVDYSFSEKGESDPIHQEILKVLKKPEGRVKQNDNFYEFIYQMAPAEFVYVFLEHQNFLIRVRFLKREKI